jgi:hypothetical protein
MNLYPSPVLLRLSPSYLRQGSPCPEFWHVPPSKFLPEKQPCPASFFTEKSARTLPIKNTQHDHAKETTMPEFVYSVKFVCGTQQESPEGCLTVRPGIYATDINIHNFQNSETNIEKFVIPLVLSGHVVAREPNIMKPQREPERITLPPNGATMDDCCHISELLGIPPVSSSPLTIGFLVIVSSQEVNVTAVYTASALRASSLSIDIEQIVGKPR